MLAFGCATGEKLKNDDARPQADTTVLVEAGTDQRPPDGGSEGGANSDSTFDGPRPDGAAVDQRADGQLADASVDGSSADTTIDRGPSPDSTLDMGAPTTNIGTVCTTSATCTGGSECLLSIDGVGLCTVADCTRDNLATAENEDSCPDPAYNICGDVTLVSGSRNFCLQRCRPRSDGNDCDGALACDVTSGYATGRLGVAVCTEIACQSGSDCPVFTGGSCDTSTLQGCDVGEICKVYSDGGFCALPGNCNTTSGLCEGHSQGKAGVTIGSPCAEDVDCGDNMACLAESSSGSTVNWRQGYCTIASCAFGDTVSAYACPTGSTCSHIYSGVHGFCQKSCDLSQAGSCRGETGDFYGDYECYAWDGLTIGGLPVASTPVCDTPIACDFLTSGCPGLGSMGNPTNMVCRNLQGNVLASGLDPSGFCLDTTSSGPTQ